MLYFLQFLAIVLLGFLGGAFVGLSERPRLLRSLVGTVGSIALIFLIADFPPLTIHERAWFMPSIIMFLWLITHVVGAMMVRLVFKRS